jgi:ribosomal protein L14E/L6E/L27E
MKELSRTELATVKRTAANVRTFRAKKAKLEAQKAKIDAELEVVNKSIDLFEAPIMEVTGGFTSEQVLNGEMDAAMRVESEVPAVGVEEAPVAENPFAPVNMDENPLPFQV